MPKKVTVYDLLISCPSDVVEYIPIIETAISRFNNSYGRLNDIVIRTFHWSKDTYPEFGDHPQTLFNNQLLYSMDIVIGMFWTKFGEPTKDYNSGTEEEIEQMISMKKQVFLYFLDFPVSPSKINQTQFDRLTAFKAKYCNESIYFSIPDSNTLMNQIRENLELYFGRIIKNKKSYDSKQKHEILWVDDHPENNVNERTILEHYGLQFSLALNTEQALKLMNDNKFSLIISDMGRKEGNHEGYVLLEQIRELDKNIPFIIYAGSNSSEHIKQTIEKGGQGCTNDLSELIDLVIKNLLTN